MTHPSRRQIERARADVLDQIGDEPWLVGIGVGLVADSPGIVISVDATGEERARALLAEMKVDVPTRIQVLGSVRKRDPI